MEEELKKTDSKTWYGYFFKGDNTIYVAMKSGDKEHVIPYPNMTFEEVKRRVKKKHFYTNLDGVEYKGFPHDMIEDCRKMAEEKWKKETGRIPPKQTKEIER